MNETICFSAELTSNISFIYNLSSRAFSYINKSFLSLLHCDESLTPSLLLSYINENDKKYLKNILNDLLHGKFSGARQIRVQLTREEIWVRVTPMLLNSDSGKIIVVSVSDITDEVHNLLILQKFANKKNSILSLLSHDLRGPLIIANNMSKALEAEASEPYTNKSARSISKILEQSINLINDLLQREFIETIEVELVKNSVDIAEKTREYMNEFKKSEEPAQRTFHFSSSAKHIFIDIDESKFMQVLNNLMSNSLKFTKERGKISLDLKEQKDSVILLFSDDGIGIPKKFHPVLFDKFTEARRQGLNGEPTIGLGLSIVKTIVDWHGGRINFETKENEGTTFIIEIPKTYSGQ
ncbi:MAG: sensor histidine kinase [Bacteroidia bacterium]